MVELNKRKFRELRCPACRKLLLYEFIVVGRVSVECSRCKTVTEFNFKSAKDVVNRDTKSSKKTLIYG